MKRKDGSVRAYALVDDADFETLGAFRWFVNSGYAARCQRVEGRWRQIKMHREILGLTDRALYVDHINGDKLDNRRANLRVATNSQNQQNRRGLPANNTSGYRGVSWERGRRKWRAQAMLDGRIYNLGYSESVEEAAEVAARFRAEHMPFTSF